MNRQKRNVRRLSSDQDSSPDVSTEIEDSDYSDDEDENSYAAESKSSENRNHIVDDSDSDDEELPPSEDVPKTKTL